MSVSSINVKEESEMDKTCDCDKLSVEKVLFSSSAFDPDLPTVKPGIFVWKFLNEEESIYLLKGEVTKNDMLSFLEKKLESNDEIITALLWETIKFCRDHLPRDPKLMSSLVGLMFFTHSYFIASRWRTPEETYNYFKESLLRHSVECPPFSMEIFKPTEAKEAILYFYDLYLRNLPLVRLVCLPHYKLKLKIQEETPIIQTERTDETKKAKI